MTTTTAGPCSARYWPSSDSPASNRLELERFPPPCMKKMTGNGDVAPLGAKTLRLRQSSSPTALVTPAIICTWGHMFPNITKLLTPGQGVTDADGCQRRAPAGDAA